MFRYDLRSFRQPFASVFAWAVFKRFDRGCSDIPEMPEDSRVEEEPLDPLEGVNREERSGRDIRTLIIELFDDTLRTPCQAQVPWH